MSYNWNLDVAWDEWRELAQKTCSPYRTTSKQRISKENSTITLLLDQLRGESQKQKGGDLKDRADKEITEPIGEMSELLPTVGLGGTILPVMTA